MLKIRVTRRRPKWGQNTEERVGSGNGRGVKGKREDAAEEFDKD